MSNSPIPLCNIATQACLIMLMTALSFTNKSLAKLHKILLVQTMPTTALIISPSKEGRAGNNLLSRRHISSTLSVGLFPSNFKLQDLANDEEENQWPRPLIITDLDNSPSSVKEYLSSLMLICRAAATPLIIYTASKNNLPTKLLPLVRIINENEFTMIDNDVVCVTQDQAKIKNAIATVAARWDYKRPQAKVMVITKEETDKLLSIFRDKVITRDIVSTDSERLSSFWKDVMDIDKLDDLKNINTSLSSAIVTAYLETYNPVGKLHEMYDSGVMIKELEFQELPYIARHLEGQGYEFCFECKVTFIPITSQGKKQYFHSIGYGRSVKVAKREAAYAMLAQFVLFETKQVHDVQN